MAGTSLKRKELRNRLKSKFRKNVLKNFTKKPVIKNIDIEKIKEGFSKKARKSEKNVEENA